MDDASSGGNAPRQTRGKGACRTAGCAPMLSNVFADRVSNKVWECSFEFLSFLVLFLHQELFDSLHQAAKKKRNGEGFWSTAHCSQRIHTDVDLPRGRTPLV
jgi:hypothetical protein